MVGGGAGGETAHETLLCPLQWRAGGGIQAGVPPSPAVAAAAAVGGGGGVPQLPVSSSAAAGPSAASPSGGAAAGAGGGGGGGGGIGTPLPPFLSCFLRPRLRASMYAPGGAALALPMDSVLPMAHVWLRVGCGVQDAGCAGCCPWVLWCVLWMCRACMRACASARQVQPARGTSAAVTAILLLHGTRPPPRSTALRLSTRPCVPAAPTGRRVFHTRDCFTPSST